MKGFVFILVIAVIGVGIWGNSQSSAKTKAIKETVKLQKENSSIESKNKVLEKTAKEIRYSQDLALKITNLKHKIKLISNKIENYNSKARNAKYAIVKMTQADRKGWYYRKGGSKNDLEPMRDLPRKWNRRDIRIVYISKAEKKQKIKKEYLAMVSKLKKGKSSLMRELAVLKTKLEKV